MYILKNQSLKDALENGSHLRWLSVLFSRDICELGSLTDLFLPTCSDVVGKASVLGGIHAKLVFVTLLQFSVVNE